MQRRPLAIEALAMDLALVIYSTTEHFPVREQYGLARELRRSAVSIGSNIAEGRGRRSSSEFHRYLDIAMGSLRELEFQQELAQSLGFIEAAEARKLEQLSAQLAAGLLGLQRRLRPT